MAKPPGEVAVDSAFAQLINAVIDQDGTEYFRLLGLLTRYGLSGSRMPTKVPSWIPRNSRT